MLFKSRRFTSSASLELFLVAPIKGIGDGCWARAWIHVAQRSGRDLPSLLRGVPLLESPLSNGLWSGRCSASGKFIDWMICAILSPLGDGVKGHSAKVSSLTWLAKDDISDCSHCILGHHVPKRSAAVIAYSPHEQAGPLRELMQVYKDIRAKHFLPDATRSWMIRCDSLPEQHTGVDAG